jgi:cytochrome c
MKLWKFIPAAALTIIGTGQALTTETPAARTPAIQAPAPEALAKKSGCFECHSVGEKAVGPPFRDVAARYKDKAGARDALREKVKKGGKGNWTEITRGVPMPPHSGRLSAADIARLVDWVLSLNDSEIQ